MAANDLQIGDNEFKLNKIDAIRQFHIVRRIAPLLREFLPIMGSIAKSKVENLTEEQKLEEFAKLASPIIDGLSKLSDADAEFVLYRLLGSVEYKQKEFGNWTTVAVDSGIKIQTLELPILMQLAGRALMFNLAGFFDSLRRVT